MTDDPTSALELEELLRELAGDDRLRGVAFRRLAPSPVDARLFFAPRALDGAAGEALAERFAAAPAVADVRRRGSDLTVRLAQPAVDRLVETLASSASPPLARPRGDGRCVVNYLNPNATKPLHAGHLRNAALGEAYAAGLEAAGRAVARQCYVCDIGRNVSEALAGWLELFGGGEPPAGRRPDVFVGECYAAYASVAARRAGRSLDELDPVAAEAVLANDSADRLLGAWLAGDAATLGAWERLRGWALDGQARTLERLGARMDRRLYESAAVEPALAFARAGLSRGLFEREPDGGIVYRTGRSEYPCVQLVRADGFPTEHARVIALFAGEQAEAHGVARWIVVCGDEWTAAGDVELEIAERIGPCPLRARVEVFTHGMVTLSGSKMKSRDGRAVLADDLLDGLEREPALLALRDEEGADVAPAALAELAVKGFFLSRKPGKAIELDATELLDPASNPGLVLARAWCRATAPPRDVGADPEAVRTAALQACQLRQLVAGAGDAYAGTEIAKLAAGVARWYLERPDARDARLSAVVRGVLRLALGALGLTCARPDVR